MPMLKELPTLTTMVLTVESGAYLLVAVVDGGKVNCDLDRSHNVKAGRRVGVEETSARGQRASS